jgi:hypothetical protein
MWQPRGRVAPAIPLIPKCFLGSPTSPVPLCGTEAVAHCPAAIARNSLMCKTSPLLRATWYDLCFVWSYSRGRSGVRPRPGRQQEHRRKEALADAGGMLRGPRG